ncbi:MAG: hypothetical protein ACM338_09025 [Betaproteobacteria bacterium]
MELWLEWLPVKTARVFVMREVMEPEIDEICKELTITAKHLWVMLCRARMAPPLALRARQAEPPPSRLRRVFALRRATQAGARSAWPLATVTAQRNREFTGIAGC